MTTTIDEPTPVAVSRRRPSRASAWFGIAFAIGQVAVLIAMSVFVLPQGGSPTDPPLERGQHVLAAATAYQIGNYAFLLSGTLLLGFLGVVYLQLRRADKSGVLATVAVAAGTLLALIWPMAGMLHDVALEAASTGADPRLLAGWDSVAPFSLAFSALARTFFIGAIVLGLQRLGAAPRLRRLGIVIAAVGVVGSATLLTGALFPVLALSTVAYEIWVGTLAWHWLRHGA